MASFKNIKNTTSENATYVAYKKLTAQDVVASRYVAKKNFFIEGADLKSIGVFSFLFDNDITPTPALSSTPTPTPSYTPTLTPTLTSTNTPTPTPTLTPTLSPTSTPPSTPPATLSNTPTLTPTLTSTVTPTVTVTNTPTTTLTPTPTPTVAAGTFNINPGYGMSVTNVTAVDGTPPQSANIPNFTFPVTTSTDKEMIDNYLVPTTFSVTVTNYPGSGTYKVDIVHYPADPIQAGYSQSTIGTINFTANGTYNITCTNPSFISINDDISIQINV